MKKISIIQIIDSLNAGGAEVLAVNIANALHKVDIESHICVTREGGILEKQISKGVGHICLNRKHIIDIKGLLKLNKYIKENKINIIHAHSTSSFVAFCLKLLNPKVKVIWHVHYGEIELIQKRKLFPLKLFSLFFSAIVSVNKNLTNWSKLNLFTKKVYLLNNFAVFNDVNKINSLKGESGKRIVHLAGFRKQKDHLNLLKAFNRVVEKHPTWSLHLIGNVFNDDYSKSIKDFISINELSNKVFIYGVCSDIKHILSEISIGVLSSRSEGLPISLLEYGLAELPVVVTDVGDCSSVVENKVTGILVRKKDSLVLQYAIINLIEDESLRKELGKKLHEKINSDYSSEIFLREITKIYKQI